MSVQRAMVVARLAHKGQEYNGKDYYLAHVCQVAAAVAASVPSTDFGELFIETAYLHDVIEDSDLTLNDLVSLGFSGSVVIAVDALTKREGEKYAAFIERLAPNPIARAVKIADLKVNLTDVPEHKKSLVSRYKKALQRLGAA